MKPTIWIIFAWTVLWLGACQQEEILMPELSGEGSLQLHVNVAQENRINARQQAALPSQFRIKILTEAKETICQWEDLAAIPAAIPLKTGKYQVLVHTPMPSLPAFEAVYYTGTSDVFEITDGAVAAVEVVAKMANVKVTVQYADSVPQDFYDYSVSITDVQHNQLTFARDETRAAYFQEGSLSAYVRLAYVGPEGDSLFLEKTQTIEEVLPNDHISITVDADLHHGNGLFAIKTTEEVNTKDVVISLEEPALPKVVYSTNLAVAGQGVAMASSYAQDSARYAKPKYVVAEDTVEIVYNMPTPDKAFDGRSTHWRSGERETYLPQWLGFDFGAGQEKVIRQYSLLVTQWGTPRSWAFQASHDSIHWEILDVRENLTLDTFESNNFDIENVLAYRYYRLVVTETTGLTDSPDERPVSFVLIRELEMREGAE